MLLVVFGAGASYDSIPSVPVPEVIVSSHEGRRLWSPQNENRPPLANQLFEDRPGFASALERFPQCHPIVPYLRDTKEPVERVLETIRTEAADDTVRLQQLA